MGGNMKKLFTLLSVFVLVALLASCAGSASKYPGTKEYKGYALSHNYYVSEATVWAKDGKVVAAELVEWFLPSHFDGVTKWSYGGETYEVSTGTADPEKTINPVGGAKFLNVLKEEKGNPLKLQNLKDIIQKVEVRFIKLRKPIGSEVSIKKKR
jgi:hypothetical protein